MILLFPWGWGSNCFFPMVTYRTIFKLVTAVWRESSLTVEEYKCGQCLSLRLLISCLKCAQYLFLSVTSHTKCFVSPRPDKRCLSHGMSLYQVIMTLHLNDVVNDIESIRNLIMTLLSLVWIESTCKLVNRIPDSRL